MNKRQRQVTTQQIDPDIRKDFPYDPMMQKLHQIRRELMSSQSLQKALKSIERTTKSVMKTV